MRIFYLMLILLLSSSQVFAAPEQNEQENETITTNQNFTLQDTIDATLQTHRGIKILKENRLAVEEELERAKAGWGPRVDVVGRTGASQLSNTTTRPLKADKKYYSTSSIGLTLTQPIWDGFETRSRVRASEATRDSLTNRIYDNATSLALDALIAHIDIIRLKEIESLAQANVDRHEEILISARDRASMGADTLADVSQAEGRLSRALSTLTESKTRVLIAEASYRRITNLPTPKSLSPVNMPEPMFISTENILDELSKNNPKVKAYIDDIRVAVSEKELTQAAMQPSLNVEIGPNYTNRSGPGQQWTSGVDLMLVARWNLFNSGADAANTKAAAARVRQSRQVLYNLADDLILQTQDTWSSYQEAIDLHKHYTKAVEYNTQTKEAYLEQFYTGQRRLLDVLDSENELFNSSTQAVTAASNIIVGAYKLYALTGTLLTNLNIDTKGLNEPPDPKEQHPLLDPKSQE